MTVCEACGSSDVLIKAWVNPNDDKATPIPLPWDKDAWCKVCDCVVDVKEFLMDETPLKRTPYKGGDQ